MVKANSLFDPLFFTVHSGSSLRRHREDKHFSAWKNEALVKRYTKRDLDTTRAWRRKQKHLLICGNPIDEAAPVVFQRRLPLSDANEFTPDVLLGDWVEVEADTPSRDGNERSFLTLWEFLRHPFRHSQKVLC